MAKKIAKQPKYKNEFWDIYEFMERIRKLIGYNVTISLVQQDGAMTLGFHCQAIPHMQDVKAYEIKFDVPEDFKEPSVNLLAVITDHVRSYIKSGGRGDTVEEALSTAIKNQA